MNIMLFIGSLEQGGAERQVVELAKGLAKKKFNVYIVIYRDKIHYKEILNSKNIKVKLIKKRKKFEFKFIFNLIKFIKRNNIDIIHSYMINTNFWARIVSLIANTKLVTSYRNINYSARYYTLENLMNFIDEFTTFNTKSAMEEYKDEVVMWDDKKLKVIYNGVNLKKFKNCNHKQLLRTKEKINYKKNKIYVGVIGRIANQKNHFCLLKALNLLPDDILNQLEILFIGRIADRNLKKQLSDYIRRHDLLNKVSFLGNQSNVAIYYHLLDLTILPSYKEGFPNVILESLASLTPVIASDISDNHILIKENKNGYLFDNDNPKSLSSKIVDFVNLSPKKKQKLSNNCFKMVKDYSINNFIDKNTKLYNKVLGSSDFNEDNICN